MRDLRVVGHMSEKRCLEHRQLGIMVERFSIRASML